MAAADLMPDLFIDGIVTKSLDIRVPDEIIAMIGRDLKIDYLGKKHCIVVSRKGNSLFPGTETECAPNNIIRVPGKIGKRLKLEAGEPVLCSYETANDCLIIRKKTGATGNPKPQPARGPQKAGDSTKTGSRPLSKIAYAGSDILTKPSLCLYQYQPEAFKNYRPAADRKDDLDSKDVLKLCEYVRYVLEADGENALFLIWRFAFGIDCNTIRSFSKTGKSVNGVCEAFRFGCQRFLERGEVVSNASLKRIFRTALSDYEIVLLHRRRGISWMSHGNVEFENDISIPELARCFRQRAFIELENTASSLGHVALGNGDIKRLSKHILNLPVEYGSLLLLRYYRRYEISEIEEQMEFSYAKGKIEYLRRAFSDRLGLAGKLISDGSFGKACALCVDSLKIL